MPGPDYLQFKSYVETQRLDIYHHGILGQKWGERNGPPYPLSNNEFDLKDLLKKSKSSNMESWGKDENHNIFYITGYSGSGKSTAANQLGKKNTNVIHLDRFTEPITIEGGNDDLDIMFDDDDEDFMKYLKTNFPEYKNITNGKVKRFSNEWRDLLDEFAYETENFSKKNNIKRIRKLL